ncbi:MAG: transporter substrate-binding domain-containing protein [Gammaproteobacteria bacterium]|nr:transporter substrate-binding domain-containing protein [Gammaproteobacteria bacterium]
MLIQRLLMAPLLALLWLQAVPAAEQTLRVGVYFNPPLSFVGDDDRPAGFIVDLLDHIAFEEGWRMQYVPCSWDGCNELLALGQIDMLAPIAVSDAEQRRLDTNRESLYVNWGQILVKRGSELRSPLDLNGRSVIALSGDVHYADLKSLAERYDIHVRFLEVDQYEDLLTWVAEGPVDAGLVSRSFDLKQYATYDLEKSNLIFNPAEIRIAFSPRNDQLQNARRIQRLDYRLAALKGNSNSEYYRLQARWFGGPDTEPVPRWLIWALMLAAVIALVLAVGVVLLRNEVRRQTRRVHEMNDRFTAFMQNLPGIAYMKHADGRYLYVNPAWERSRYLMQSNVLGKRPEEIWPDHEMHDLMPQERTVLETLKPVESLESNPWDSRASRWRLIRFPIIDDSGEARMVGGIGLDISAQHEAEAQAIRLNRQLELLLEFAGDGIFGLDKLGRCSFINRKALQLLGYGREDLVGSRLLDRIQHSRRDGSDYPEHESPIYRAINGGDPSRIDEAFFWRENGEPLRVAYTVHPLTDAEYSGAVVVFRRLRGDSDAAA